MIFRNISNPNEEGKSIASLGCGSGIDYYSMGYAEAFEIGDYSWAGFDLSKKWLEALVDGQDEIDEPDDNIEEYFYNKGAEEYFSGNPGTRTIGNDPVIIFPRSFGDIMANTDLNDMISLAEKATYNLPDYFLCIVHTNDEDKKPDDYEKAKIFLSGMEDILRKQGYDKRDLDLSSIPSLVYKDKDTGYIKFENPESGIVNIDSNFSGPFKVVGKLVNDINKDTKDTKDTKDITDATDTTDTTGGTMNPITTVKYSNYQILHFVK